jgi:hypothetical protein
MKISATSTPPKDPLAKARASDFSFDIPSKSSENPTLPHSHSIILSDATALISNAIFFCARGRTVSPIRQKFALLIAKKNFTDSEICSVSATIANDRSIFVQRPPANRQAGAAKKALKRPAGSAPATDAPAAFTTRDVLLRYLWVDNHAGMHLAITCPAGHYSYAT